MTDHTIDSRDLLRRAIAAETSGWTDQQRVALLHRLARESTRLAVRAEYPTAGALAQHIDPNTVQTPALEAIDEALEWALSTPDARLAISMPPQEGKTTRVAVWGVIRALVQDPDRRIVVASYSDPLARSTSRQARNLIREHGAEAQDPLTGAPLPDQLGLALADDKSAAGNWKLAGHTGGMYAVGVGGSLTGTPADCIDGDTVVISEHGPMSAREVHNHPPKFLLGYDPRSNRPTWHHLEATRRIGARHRIAVQTGSGATLTCTPDHRVYTRSGYTPAGDLRPGQEVLQLDAAPRMQAVRQPLHREEGRGPEESCEGRKYLLQHGVRGREFQPPLPDPILLLRLPDPELKACVLLGLLRRVSQAGPSEEERLPTVREDVRGALLKDDLLREEVRRCSALNQDAGNRQFVAPEGSITDAPLHGDKASDQGPRREHVRDLHVNRAAGRPSLQRGPSGQQAGEFDHPVQCLPSESPSWERVSVVGSASDGAVYDFQVDGGHNFFADGILVHNCLIIDDPLKGMAEADSKVERDKVITWWDSVAQTRLAPGAPVITIQTRWHEQDLVGHVLEQDKVRGSSAWWVVNIPAVSTPGVPDVLGREPGVAMVSARGRTPADFDRIRSDVGERVWAALYLGTPTPAQGGLFSQEWFDRHRSGALPESTAARLVSVDPAETGQRDEAGIIGMAVTADGRAWVTDDRSGKMQSDEWARAAVLLALETRAGELLFEAFTTGPTYERVIEDAWKRVRREARLLREHGNPVAATKAYTRLDTVPPNPLRALQEVQGLPVPDQDTPPFRIRPWRAKGDKTARAAGARQAASTGRLRMVGTHPVLESQASAWQQGQSSPDRMDALVNGFERAMQLVGAEAQIANPAQVTRSASRMGGFWSQTIG